MQPTHTTGNTADFSGGGPPLDELAIQVMDDRSRKATCPCLQPALTSQTFIQVPRSSSSEVTVMTRGEELQWKEEQ